MKLTPVDGGKKTSVEKIGCLHNTIESFDSHTFTFLPGGDSRDSVSVSIPFHAYIHYIIIHQVHITYHVQLLTIYRSIACFTICRLIMIQQRLFPCQLRHHLLKVDHREYCLVLATHNTIHKSCGPTFGRAMRPHLSGLEMRYTRTRPRIRIHHHFSTRLIKRREQCENKEHQRL